MDIEEPIADTINLVLETDPILRRKADPVMDFESFGAIRINRIKELMIELDGLGLSAPQVGISLRFFVSKIKGAPVAINPRIASVSPRTVSKSEGCLTWPGKYRFKRRYDWILAEWFDRNGKFKTKRLKGLDARIFQHELDHLDGICLF